MKTGYQNEHGFDCAQFMALASPHRWMAVADFMQDRNGCISYVGPLASIEVTEMVGEVGLRPDIALMFKEDRKARFNAAQLHGFKVEQRHEDEVIARASSPTRSDSLKKYHRKRKLHKSCPHVRMDFPQLAPPKDVPQLPRYIPPLPTINVPSYNLPSELRAIICEAQSRDETTLIFARSGEKTMDGFLVLADGRIVYSRISSWSLDYCRIVIERGAKKLVGKAIANKIEYPYRIGSLH